MGKEETAMETHRDIVEDKKKKGTSIGKVFICFALGIALVGGGVSFFTGAWNPFKSRSVSKVAQEIYENEEQDSIDFIKTVDIDMNDGKFNSSHYGPDKEFPYGFQVKDYGSDTVNGVLMEKASVDALLHDKYGGFFTLYYMKNFDYAKEYYIGSANSIKSKSSYSKETIIDEKTKVYFFIDDLNLPEIYILKNTMVYELIINDMKNLPNAQNLFDFLKIDYTVPKESELYTAA